MVLAVRTFGFCGLIFSPVRLLKVFSPVVFVMTIERGLPPHPPTPPKKKRKKDKEKAENSRSKADGSGHSWGTLKRLAKDRTARRSFVTALNVDRR